MINIQIEYHFAVKYLQVANMWLILPPHLWFQQKSSDINSLNCISKTSLMIPTLAGVTITSKKNNR